MSETLVAVGSLTKYAIKKLYRLVGALSSQEYGGSVYLALSTSAPVDSGDSRTITEPSTANGYKRILMGVAGQSATQKFQISGDALVNKDEVLFESVKNNAWGTVTHWALFDSQSGGNCLASGLLVTSLTDMTAKPLSPAVGDVVYFPAGSIKIVIDEVA